MPIRVVHPPGTAGTHGWASDFQSQLAKQYGALKMPVPPTATDFVTAREHPELLVYFATAPWNELADPALAQALKSYADHALHLLPVIDKEPDAATHLAPALQRFNAFIATRYPSVLAEALVDEAMTLLWQRRRQRRIFISYKRSESQASARLLADYFSERSFAVFLDERSIEPAVDFQNELRAHLDDSDAVLVLVTPGLTNSRWVREELQFARTRRIGLLGVVWPTVPDKPTPAAVAQLDHDQQVWLSRPATNVVGSEHVLTDQDVKDVAHVVFEGRARAVARRTSSLIDDAEPRLAAAIAPYSVVARRNDGDLDLERSGEPWLGRIAPFRPSHFDLWRWWDELRQLTTTTKGMLVLYPCVDSRAPSERAFRAICDVWGRAVTPRVELMAVHL